MSAEEKTGIGRKSRRRYAPEEKIRLLDEADKPGESIGTVSRRHGVSPSVMFVWRRLRETGAMTAVKADEELVQPAHKFGSCSACSGRRPRRSRFSRRVWR